MLGLLITHAHPDHHGLAARVRAASGCWVAMHPLEQRAIREQFGRAPVSSRRADWRRFCGMPDDAVPAVGAGGGRFHGADLVLDADVLLEDGDDADPGRAATAIWTPANAGHLVYSCPAEGVVLTGDHLLPRITPNISTYTTDDGDPLGQYLESLAVLPPLDPAEALPGHEYRFRGLGARVGPRPGAPRATAHGGPGGSGGQPPGPPRTRWPPG